MEIQKILLLCGVIAGPLFIIVFLIEGALRNGYDAVRRPVSALALGKRGWIQRTNFIVTGALMFGCAFGLHFALASRGGSFWGPFLIGLYALGLVGAGVFVTDAGMRNNAPKSSKQYIDGRLHDVCSLFVFIPLFIDCFVFAHLFAVSESIGWQIYSIASGILFGIGFALFARGFVSVGKLPHVAGLLQRLTIAIGWLWVASVAAHFLVA